MLSILDALEDARIDNACYRRMLSEVREFLIDARKAHVSGKDHVVLDHIDRSLDRLNSVT